jgi:short-subunit dehydrogenase
MPKEEMKRAVIAGATSAIGYIERNRNASEDEVMRHVTREMGKILRNIDEGY